MAATMIQSEIEKFNNVSKAERWWNGGLLHKMNAVRVPFIRDGILENCYEQGAKKDLQSLKGIKILDAGCGGGILAESLAKLGATVVGVDVAPNLIEVAQAHAKLDETLADTLTYVNSSIEEHAEAFPNHYDVVVSSEVVEHVNNRKDFVGLLTKLAKPSGSVFITTINRNFQSLAKAIILMEHVAKIIPIGTHSYQMLVRPEELRHELESRAYFAMLWSNGCKVKEIRGMMYNLRKCKWQYCKNTEVWYLLHAIKP